MVRTVLALVKTDLILKSSGDPHQKENNPGMSWLQASPFLISLGTAITLHCDETSVTKHTTLLIILPFQ